ncbi:MAG: crossover junction endodeoxyribonuclease RuvC [Acuticoccus sp.]
MAVTILGIDPGLRATGWGAIAADGSRLSFLAAGTIASTAGEPLAIRLAALYRGLCDVVDSIGPHEAAVEQTFVSRDGAATLKLGQARGIALLVPSLGGVPVAEYAPNLVKKTVVGAGHADKHQIRHMVKMLLPKVEAKTEHAFDALAIAICHASHRRALRPAA